VKVAIDVRVMPGEAGGVAPAVRSLISALSSLEDGPEVYTVVVGSQKQADWLSPSGSRHRFVFRPQSSRHPLLRPLWPLVRRIQNYLTLPGHWPEVPLSDGFFEGLGCDVIHFPTQSYTVCALPSVYNPIDLQHLHYPQFFDARAISWRESVYRTGCNLAQALIVNSDWIKNDVVRNYRVDPEKIHVIAEASPTTVPAGLDPAGLDEVRLKYSLDATFILYPAVTWPHKNHVRLFEALAYLRDQRGLLLPLVCTGSRFQPFWPELESALARLQLASQVRFLGHVPEADLRALYQLATAVALPSLFEANSLPVFEAWLAGTPVTCSNTTGLPEQVGDAALLFSPLDHVQIAEALATLVSDQGLRTAIRQRGFLRSREYTWERTARAYRALYRKVGGRPMTDEDKVLLGVT
jgi:glycosyltransferase involved in cell wall biosynthesis